MKIAVFIDRLGPYHCAKFSALGRCVSLSVFEYFDRDSVYGWGRQADSIFYSRSCLFPGAASDQCTFRRVQKAVRDVLVNHAFDVVMIPGYGTARALATLEETSRAGLPAVLMSDTTDKDRMRNPATEMLKGLIVRAYSSAFVAGDAQTQYLVRLGISREIISTGYCAVDNEHFGSLRHEIPDILRGIDKPYFFCCARLAPEKNLIRLIKAYRRYLDKTTQGGRLLVIAGDGEQRVVVRKLVEGLGLSAGVIFVGFVDYDDLPGFYQNAEWFVLPSTAEPWGLVINEALASGLPVLVSERCGSVGDLVKEGLTGWTFNPYSIECIADCLIRAHRAAGRRLLMKEHALATVQSFGLEQFAMGAQRALEMALSRGPKPHGAIDTALRALAALR